ncbi:hypothetical protein NAF17_11835 [Mucilaginibacter sp. RB4R14]|uniref:hypothetical protein n=1 Tax=Mucilaginibacter aurantiaciroseus TaxID=2949308 RepID=UPI0020910649|nr:hypothetical protein [Mucilaginibacter aurantiaciroseus]MCO5936229.1 hypothetical protein [Mucilaginibacter aurantiaciroseus]
MIASVNLYGQEIRVNNSFVILVNDKLMRSVSGVKFVTFDANGKEDRIDGGYYPGVLYVYNTLTKNLLYADNLNGLIMKFDYYEYSGGKQTVNNYSIELNKTWLKESLIIVKIFDVNIKRGTYNYTFEVPGVSFGKLIK